MIHTFKDSSHRELFIINETLHLLEQKLVTLSYFPVVATVTGGLEVLVGTTATISAIAAWLFYTVRLRLPCFTEEKKRIWAQDHAVENSSQLLRNSVKMVAMGVLKAIFFVGNVGAYVIYNAKASAQVTNALEQTFAQVQIQQVEPPDATVQRSSGVKRELKMLLNDEFTHRFINNKQYLGRALKCKGYFLRSNQSRLRALITRK